MDPRQRYLIRLVVIIAGLIGALIVIDEVTDTDYPVITGSNPVTDAAIREGYPALYEAVFNREAHRLKPFFGHEAPEVRVQTWRALANTPVEADSLAWYIDRALQTGAEAEAAWFGISRQELSGGQLRMLEEEWEDNKAHRNGISRVFGQQGDSQTLDFLLGKFDEAMGSAYEKSFSLAVGRLSLRHALTPREKINVIGQAFESSDVRVTRGYLYGFYRDPGRQLETVVKDSLYRHWRGYGVGARPEVDQYAVRIIPDRALHEVAIYYNGEERLEGNVQLSVELAQMLSEVALNDRTTLDARFLLTHPNPHVVQQALESLSGRIGPSDNLYTFIRNQILPGVDTGDFVWLQALKTLGESTPELIGQYSEKINQVGERNPYFLPDVLELQQKVDSPGVFLDRIELITEEKGDLSAMYAVQALNRFAGEYEPGSTKGGSGEDITDRVRSLAFTALSRRDRGIAYAAQPLLMNRTYFNKADFKRINRSLAGFSLPEDIEVYQAFGRLYRQRFEQQARTFIDSLASLGYSPLNRSLSEAGWDVEMPEQLETGFRTPGWERLWNGIGYDPLWVLVTEKGPVKLRLDLLSAPATISAIDSLTQAGAYNGIPFHRVVPNFVIQGGDFERGDGFGGPDFVLPTEGSERSFNRGRIGIASAGSDTEGSQYFIMHQWKPHLDGSYTNFGQVVEGMDVVDRIVPGDSVRTVYWE